MTLFEAGEQGYVLFRIPSLLATGRGTLLAFCEARRAASDSGSIDLVLRRSTDGGRTWSPMTVIDHDRANTVGNPCPVETADGRILLLYNGNDGEIDESDILEGLGVRRVCLLESRDDGMTWGPRREITAEASRPEWTWYACGPCHGVTLPGGRLVIPCNHGERPRRAGAKSPYIGHVILSDDGGAIWRIGALAGPDTNEATAACLPDGTLYLNFRSFRERGCRQVSRSRDGGETMEPVVEDPALAEPCCQGSTLALGTTLLFLNPASATERTGLTLRASRDGGATWPWARTVCPGPAAYSDMAALGDTLFLLYETGEAAPYERIALETVPRAELPS